MSDKVLAVVAGKEITEADIKNVIQNYPLEQQIQMMNPEARKDITEQLIAFHLFAKMAEEEKIIESDEYKETLERIKVEIASHMAATKVVEGLSVSEEEEKAFYESEEQLFMSGLQAKAKHILTDSKEKAEEIAKKIENNEVTFEEAAKEHSTCPSKERGGDLGYFSKGQMVPEFEEACFNGEIGKVLGPVQTQFGFHLILVDDKKEAAKMEFEQVKDQIHEQLIKAKQKRAYDEKIKELESKYTVERK